MADMRTAFSKYFKAADVDQPITYTIASVAEEKVGDDTKWVVRFNNEKRGFVLNSTNNDRLCNAFGYDSDDWAGRRVTLTTDLVQGKGGGMVQGLVVQIPKPKGKVAAAVEMQAPFDDPIDDLA
jgi:hypothetical protein